MPLTASLIIGGVGLAAKGAGFLKARKDEKRAKSELEELSKIPYAKYAVSPEHSAYYSKILNNVNNPVGLTAAERQQANAGINTAMNTQRYNVAGTSGGNLSRYISGAINNQGVNAQNQLAMRDAQMRQSNQMQNTAMLGQAAGQFQNVSNLNTSQELNRRMMIERALGESAVQNKSFQTNTLNSIGSDLISGGLMLGMGGGGENGLPFAGIRNALTPRNTNYSVDPAGYLKTNPLEDYRNTRSNLNKYVD